MNTSAQDTNSPLVVTDLTGSAVDLTARLVDIPSVSHEEQRIADELDDALRQWARTTEFDVDPQIDIYRQDNTLVLRTQRGLGSRVILAGHIDTVPVADNIPSQRIVVDDQDVIAGLGSVDMKSGDAAYIHTFVTLAGRSELQWDMTLVLYEGEEVATQFNGLAHIAQSRPELLSGDLALLGEPSGAHIEAGCQGSIRVKVTAHGTRSHSARSWLGHNALHALAPVLTRVADFGNPEVTVDGCAYREGMNAVMADAGVATNTIPDQAWMFVNYRYAPDKTTDQALNILCDVLGVGTPENPSEGYSLEIDDLAPGARPGLDQPLAQALISATGGMEQVAPKFGWTDVARFSELGIPALNFGPGDPSLCHTPQENCPEWMIKQVTEQLMDFLQGKFS